MELQATDSITLSVQHAYAKTVVSLLYAPLVITWARCRDGC